MACISRLIVLMALAALPLSALAFGGKVDTDSDSTGTQQLYLQPDVPPVVITRSAGNIGTGLPVIAIAANHASWLRVLQDGTLQFRGNNDMGQDGAAQGVYNNWTNTLSGVLMVAGGYDFTYAATANVLYAAGDNDRGQLGIGSVTAQQTSWQPVQTDGGKIAFPIRSIAAGRKHGLLIDAKGFLWVVGDNSLGQAGTNPPSCPWDGNGCGPAVAAWPAWHRIGKLGGNALKQVAAGADHSLALDSAGNIWVTGDSQYAQTGLETSGDVLMWQQTEFSAASGTTWSAIGAGWYTSFAITTNHYLYAAGRNDYGQLGAVTQGATSTGMPVDSNVLYQSIGSGGIFHSYAIDQEGVLRVAGDNSSGQYGIGYANAGQPAGGAAWMWTGTMPATTVAAVSAVDIGTGAVAAATGQWGGLPAAAPAVGMLLQNDLSWLSYTLSANGTPQYFWNAQ